MCKRKAHAVERHSSLTFQIFRIEENWRQPARIDESTIIGNFDCIRACLVLFTYFSFFSLFFIIFCYVLFWIREKNWRSSRFACVRNFICLVCFVFVCLYFIVRYVTEFLVFYNFSLLFLNIYGYRNGMWRTRRSVIKIKTEPKYKKEKKC